MTMHGDRSSVPATEEPNRDPETGLEASAQPSPEPMNPPEEEPALGASSEASAGSGDVADGPLIPADVAMDFQSRWEAVQQGFVDDPRTAVTDADRLVGHVLQRLSTTFEDQHHNLERQWSDGEPSTEDLRGALQRYRTFFDRLLTL